MGPFYSEALLPTPDAGLACDRSAPAVMLLCFTSNAGLREKARGVWLGEPCFQSQSHSLKVSWESHALGLGLDTFWCVDCRNRGVTIKLGGAGSVILYPDRPSALLVTRFDDCITKPRTH